MALELVPIPRRDDVRQRDLLRSRRASRIGPSRAPMCKGDGCAGQLHGQCGDKYLFSKTGPTSFGPDTTPRHFPPVTLVGLKPNFFDVSIRVHGT